MGVGGGGGGGGGGGELMKGRAGMSPGGVLGLDLVGAGGGLEVLRLHNA